MNYQWHYERLVSTRKSRAREEGKYYERHHVIPRSMGGTDDESNLVYLTAREHFLAHWLLWRIHRNREMAFAFFAMHKWKRNNEPKKFSSICYQEAKESMTLFLSEKMKQQTIWKGRKQSDEHIQKRVEKIKGKTRKNKSKFSEESRKNMSESRKLYLANNPIVFSEETKKKISSSLKGIKRSEETKKKMSNSQKGHLPTKGNAGNTHTEESKRKMSETIKKNSALQKYQCPHCLREGIGRSFKGWHFNRCKSKPANQ